MKRRILTTLIIFLTITSGVNFVSAENMTVETNNLTTQSNIEENMALERESRSSEEENNENEEETENRIGENVTALESGYYNVSFDDGYNGFCVNHRLHSTSRGENFTVKDTSTITSNVYSGESVGNYLKILFTEFHNYTMNPTTNIADMIWKFTDTSYKNSNNAIVNQILELGANGLIIKDHGEVRKINNTTEAVFDFEALDSHKGSTQNFFGYKITYRDILINNNDTPLGSPETNESEDNNETLNPTPENNTTNTTNPIPENNTTNTTNPIPENNTTENNNETPDIIVDETPEEDVQEEEETTETDNITKNSEDSNKTPKSSQNNLIKYATGNPILLLLAGLMLSLVVVKHRRD